MNKIIETIQIDKELADRINAFLEIDDFEENEALFEALFEALGLEDNDIVFQEKVVKDGYTMLLTVNKGTINGWIDFSIKRHSDNKWFQVEPIFEDILGEYSIEVDNIEVSLNVVAA